MSTIAWRWQEQLDAAHYQYRASECTRRDDEQIEILRPNNRTEQATPNHQHGAEKAVDEVVQVEEVRKR